MYLIVDGLIKPVTYVTYEGESMNDDKLHESQLFFEEDAAKFLGISQITMARIRKRGEVAFHRIGTRPRYRREDLEAYIESQRQPVVTARMAA